MDSNDSEFPLATEFGRSSNDVQPTRRPRGSWLLAWLLIILMVGIMIVPHAFNLADEEAEPSIIQSEIQAKYVIGAASVAVQGEKFIDDQIRATFNKGSLPGMPGLAGRVPSPTAGRRDSGRRITGP